jgi:hypothetical protein
MGVLRGLLWVTFVSAVVAQIISPDSLPSRNSSGVSNYLQAREEYIASEQELRQGERSCRAPEGYQQPLN